MELYIYLRLRCRDGGYVLGKGSVPAKNCAEAEALETKYGV